MATAIDFFTSINKIATPYFKQTAKTDPVKAAQMKFAKVADEQVKLLLDGKDKGYCFKKIGDVFVVTLKNGPSQLNKANPSYQLANAADAIKLFESAKKAALAGELDVYFNATKRAAKVSKKATEVAESAPETAQNSPKTAQKK
jgi:hypothetical protein